MLLWPNKPNRKPSPETGQLQLTFIDALRSEEYIVHGPRGPSVTAPRVARKKNFGKPSRCSARPRVSTYCSRNLATIVELQCASNPPPRSTADLSAA
jgi:hypothetical protein